MSHPWIRHLAAVLLCGGLYLGLVSAQETGDAKKAQPVAAKEWELPKVLKENRAPASIEELREIENHVQKVVDKVMPSVVGLQIGGGQGSGVIIREDGTILTAGHVSGTPDKNASVKLFGSFDRKGKTNGRNKGIDSGMVKIENAGETKFPFLEMGKSADLKAGQWVIAIGHPGGVRANRGPVVRVGRILVASQFVLQTDCTLVGGDSGGPLFDMQGRVIGIHSRIGGAKITENMHVPIDTYRDEWDRLVKGEDYGKGLGQLPTVLSLGGTIVFEAKDKLTKDDSTEQCPKDPNDKKLLSFRKVYNVAMKTGHTYTIDLISADKTGKFLDTFLRLESSAGAEIAHDDDGGGFPNSRIVYRAAADGDYKIIATSFEPKQVGNFTLTVRDADFRSGDVEVLKAVKIPFLKLDTTMKTWAAKKIQLHVHATLVDDKGMPVPDKELTLKWQDGKETMKTNGAGYLRWALKKENSKNLSVELPKGIRAVFVLVDQDGEYVPHGSGSTDDPSIEKVKSAGGKLVKTIDGKIAKTDPFDFEREKCYRHIHEFKMSAGKTYTIDLASEEFNAYLRVEHDDKGKLAEDDDGAGFLNSRIVFTPEEDGTYRLVVTTTDGGQTGSYRLTVRQSEAKKAIAPKK